MDDIRESFLSRLHHYRGEDSHECAQISARMNWLMIIQSGLIVSFFIISTLPNPIIVFVNSVFIFCAAVFFAKILSKAVRKAELIVQEWHKKERALYNQIKELKNNDLITELESYFVIMPWDIKDEKELKKEADAFSFQRIVFPGLMMFWTALILFSGYNFIEREIGEMPKIENLSLLSSR